LALSEIEDERSAQKVWTTTEGEFVILPHQNCDEAALFARAKADSRNNLAASLTHMRRDLGRLVERHPFLFAGTALALGFIGAKAAKRHFRREGDHAPKPQVVAAAPVPPPSPTASRFLSVVMTDFVIPFLADRITGMLKNPTATDRPAQNGGHSLKI
jgi:hypothetical protein